MMLRTRFLCLVLVLALFGNLAAFTLANDDLFDDEGDYSYDLEGDDLFDDDGDYSYAEEGDDLSGDDSDAVYDLSSYLEERLELSSILLNTLTDASLDSDGSVIDFGLRIHKEIQLDELLFLSPLKPSSAQKTIDATFIQDAQGYSKSVPLSWANDYMTSHALSDSGDGILCLSHIRAGSILEPGIYSFRISGQKFGYNEHEQVALIALGSSPSGRGSSEVIEYLSSDQLSELASQGKSEGDYFDELDDEKAYYDSLPAYESKKPSFTSFNLLSDPSHLYRDIDSLDCDTIYVDFRADGTVTLGDIYFGVPYRYEDVKGTSIRLERFREDDNISVARCIPAETIATVPASLFLGKTPVSWSGDEGGSGYFADDPADAVLTDVWSHVLGGSFNNLVLEDGVYRITLLPRAKAVEILAGADLYGLIVTGEGRFYQLSHDQIDLLSGNRIHLVNQIIGSENGLSYIDSYAAAEAALYAEAERVAPAFMEEYNQQHRDAARQEEKAAEDKAKQPIKLIIDGVTLNFGSDQAPVIVNGRTLVPMRAVVETLGYTVAWDSTSKIMDVYDSNTEAWLISMTIGSKVAKVGTRVSWVMDDRILDVPPQIINNRTMIPVRFVGETLGCDVKWNADTRTITIIS